MASYARPAVLVALLALAIQPAGAQGFLDSLFGPDEASPSRPASGYVRTRPAASLFDGVFGPSEYDTPAACPRHHLPHPLCAHVRRLLFPDQLCDQQCQFLA